MNGDDPARIDKLNASRAHDFRSMPPSQYRLMTDDLSALVTGHSVQGTDNFGSGGDGGGGHARGHADGYGGGHHGAGHPGSDGSSHAQRGEWGPPTSSEKFPEYRHPGEPTDNRVLNDYRQPNQPTNLNPEAGFYPAPKSPNPVFTPESWIKH